MCVFIRGFWVCYGVCLVVLCELIDIFGSLCHDELDVVFLFRFLFGGLFFGW